MACYSVLVGSWFPVVMRGGIQNGVRGGPAWDAPELAQELIALLTNHRNSDHSAAYLISLLYCRLRPLGFAARACT